MEKQLKAVNSITLNQNAPGFKTATISDQLHGIEPYLIFSEFEMDRPIFGPHPHAGVSVITYIFPDSKGSFLNRDSRGDASSIEQGGMHVTQAGRGVLHDEVPSQTGITSHGLQIWLNHSDANRLVEPKAFHAQANEIPEVKGNNTIVRVLQGEYLGQKAPFDLVTKTHLFDVKLGANQRITLPAYAMAFVYLLDGRLSTNQTAIEGRTVISYQEAGDTVTVETKTEGAHFMYASGTPHNEPIVYGGPFVMTTNEQMLETKRRVARGEMGILI
jgi:quercetin 2,3-dioxygenase